MYKARTNCLPLNDRKRHSGESTACEMCAEENEDLKHLILFCPAYIKERQMAIQLQQPYNEDKNDIIGRFLFKTEDMEEKKESLYRIWKKRCENKKNP